MVVPSARLAIKGFANGAPHTFYVHPRWGRPSPQGGFIHVGVHVGATRHMMSHVASYATNSHYQLTEC